MTTQIHSPFGSKKKKKTFEFVVHELVNYSEFKNLTSMILNCKNCC